MPDGTQSQLALATRTISATNPDALALSTANVALGGLFTSRLNQQLREVRGWTYGMFSSVGFNKRTGVFQVRGSVVAQHTVDSLKDIESELKRYATGDITEDELQHAKEGILQSLPQALETNDAVASTFVTLSSIGRPLDWYATLPARLGALERDEVARVSRAYLDPTRLPVVVVGPKTNQEGLAELQLGPVVDRTAEAKGLAAASRRRRPCPRLAEHGRRRAPARFRGRPPARAERRTPSGRRSVMRTQLHRGRLIDHVHLVVADVEASQRFYRAVLSVLGIALGGEGKEHFWADELFVSTADSRHSEGPADRAGCTSPSRRRIAPRSTSSTAWAWPAARARTARRASGATTPTTTPRSCSTPTGTTSRRCTTAPTPVRPSRS